MTKKEKNIIMSNFKNYLPYLEILAGFLGSILILFLIFDNWLFPALIKNKEVVEVPYIVGKKLEDAIMVLQNKNLEYVVVAKQSSEKYPADYIIKQIPNAGTKVKESRQILLTISKGTETTTVPYLVGKELGYAKNQLQQNELQSGNIYFEPNDSIPNNVIIRQNPSSGREVALGSTVDLVVSSGGSNIVLVPDLLGKTYNEAESIILELGLRIGEVYYLKNETYLPNTIFKQTPNPKDSTKKGFQVNLFIAK